jgi:glutathione S-transferase
MLNFAPEAARNEAVNGFLKGRVVAALKVLDNHLKGRDWIVADRPTIADVACSGYLFYPREEYGWTEEERWPNIEAWMDRMKALDGWAHPYDLMPGHPMGSG